MGTEMILVGKGRNLTLANFRASATFVKHNEQKGSNWWVPAIEFLEKSTRSS